MTNTQKFAVAALAGLMSSAFVVPAFAAEHDGAAMVKTTEKAMEKNACKGLNSCKGKGADGKNECKGKGSCATSKEKEKHACKGHNSCKGQGADGKNECKGKGSCATDGSK
jgi:hypothetical protein